MFLSPAKEGQPSTREVFWVNMNSIRRKDVMSKPAQSKVKKNSCLCTYIKMIVKSGRSVKYLVRREALCSTPGPCPARQCPEVAGCIRLWMTDGMMTPHWSWLLVLCLLYPDSSWWQPQEPQRRCVQSAWECSPRHRGGFGAGQSMSTKRASSSIMVKRTMADWTKSGDKPASVTVTGSEWVKYLIYILNFFN